MEPTKEQLRLATFAYFDAKGTETGTTKDGLLAAAPHLQLPWMDASREELAEVFARYNAYHPDTSPLTRFMLAMNLFVQKRNSEIVSKPPMRGFVQEIMNKTRGVSFTAAEGAALMQQIKGATYVNTTASYGDDHVG